MKKLLPILVALLLVPLTAAQQLQIILTVVDDSGQPVPGAQVTVRQPGSNPINLSTDYAGRCRYNLARPLPYQLSITKPGYYSAHQDVADPLLPSVQAVLTHQHLLQQQVEVTATAPGIDTQEPSDKTSLNAPEITNVPNPTSRDIRNLLPFIPGVVADSTGQVHVAGSESWQTLYLLNGFDIRSPASGLLAMHVSADAVRSIDAESTRYPVQYGRTTGGVIAFYTGTAWGAGVR